jgi:hypothetical protein
MTIILIVFVVIPMIMVIARIVARLGMCFEHITGEGPVGPSPVRPRTHLQAFFELEQRRKSRRSSLPRI